MQFLTLNIGLFLGLMWLVRVEGEPDWTFDLLEIDCINNTPDLLNASINLKRIARGYFVVEGDFTIGEDLTDETIFHAEAFYSLMGQHFVPTPFNIPKMPLSQFFNTFYKDLILDTMSECSTNPPISDRAETFIPPWRKGVMVLNNCTFTNDEMPSHLRPGYYKCILEFSNQVDSTVTILGRVDPK